MKETFGLLPVTYGTLMNVANDDFIRIKEQADASSVTYAPNERLTEWMPGPIQRLKQYGFKTVSST